MGKIGWRLLIVIFALLVIRFFLNGGSIFAHEPSVIKPNDKITEKFFEMTYEKAAISEEINPFADSNYSFYSYYGDNKDEMYLFVEGTFKNLTNKEYDLDNIVAQFIVNDKQVYGGAVIAYDDDDFLINGCIDASQEVHYYIITSLPNEIVHKYSTCKVKFAFNENLKPSVLERNINDYKYFYEINLKNNLKKVTF